MNYTPLIYLNDISTELKKIIENFSTQNIFVLTDKNVFRDCYPLIKNIFEVEPKLLIIEAGEESKNLDTVQYLWSKLIDYQTERQSLLINLGGGVITDIGGFVAATFKRGIKFLNIPTSLLAQVDAAIGGKNGINFRHFKNNIGTFYNPLAIISSPVFLKTLPERHFVAGFAEVVKHALLDNARAWNKIKFIDPADPDYEYMENVVRDSAKFKQKIVEKDPKETGLREILNFGHTFGHAIETFFRQKRIDILHGEAVAMGIICELFLSNKILNFDFQKLFEISEYIATFFPSYKINYDDYDEIFDLMLQDKKNKNKRITFTLLEDIGKPLTNQTASKDEMIQAFNFYYQIKR